MGEVNEPTVKIGDNNSNNSISVLGMDIHKAISTGVIIGCLLLSTAVMNIRYNNVQDEIHVMKVEQEKVKEQVKYINQQYEQQLELSNDILNKNTNVMDKLDTTVNKFSKSVTEFTGKISR